MLSFRALITLALGSFSPNVYTRGVQTSGDLPSYALTYAPIIHLWSREEFWPSDPAIHLQHVAAKKDDFSNDTAAPNQLTLSNLDYPGSSESTYLTGNDDVETEPEWLRSTYGKPGYGGRSAAPSAIIAVDKVFYSIFYLSMSRFTTQYSKRAIYLGRDMLIYSTRSFTVSSVILYG